MVTYSICFGRLAVEATKEEFLATGMAYAMDVGD